MSSILADLIKEQILKNGHISFRDFMDICLYHDKYGYYRGSIPPIGVNGDFVTSPHSNRLFGALLANQIEEFWSLLQVPEMTIVEMGAGAGYLAYDILHALSKYDFYDKILYVIIEPNKKYIEYQKKILGNISGKVVWFDKIEDMPEVNGCFISNELLDSFPVFLVKKVRDFYYELAVTYNNSRFCFKNTAITNKEILNYLSQFEIKSDDYQTEVNLEIKIFLDMLSKKIKKGFVLTIDYGYVRSEYFSPVRNRGTLLSYKSHVVTDDILQNPGEQDITSHVNFSDLSTWGSEVGLNTVGYTNQWAFLAALDFEIILKTLYPEITPFSPELAGIKALIFPQGMGETHKVLIQSKNMNVKTLKGFKLKNIKHKL